jgi:hypothetical protein
MVSLVTELSVLSDIFVGCGSGAYLFLKWRHHCGFPGDPQLISPFIYVYCRKVLWCWTGTTWRAVDEASLNVQFQYLLGGTVENHDTSQSGMLWSGLDLCPGHFELLHFHSDFRFIFTWLHLNCRPTFQRCLLPPSSGWGIEAVSYTETAVPNFPQNSVIAVWQRSIDDWFNRLLIINQNFK